MVIYLLVAFTTPTFCFWKVWMITFSLTQGVMTHQPGTGGGDLG